MDGIPAVASERAGDTVYEVAGAGPPVVLIHGLGLTREVWSGQVSALAPWSKTIRYDLLGHGESEKPAGAYPMRRFTDQLGHLLDALELDRVALVGFSLGGLIVQAFALAHPSRVRALAILNAAHDRTEAERAAIRKRVQQAAAGGPAATVESALERWFTEAGARRRPEKIGRAHV